VTAPLPATALPPGVQPRLPAAHAPPSATIPPAPPSRSGLLVMALVLVLLFLVGVFGWWILRGR
jgi:hypothetical protein